MKCWFVWALVALMVVGANAGEEKSGKGQGGPFEIMDADKDGKVSKEEFVSFKEAQAEKADNEFDAEKVEQMFAKKDKDGDGFLTKEEMASKPKKKEASKE